MAVFGGSNGSRHTCRWVLVGALWCLVGHTASTALAHPLVDEGVRLAEIAEFDQALEAFERAAAADDLTREDLAKLLAERALMQHALGETQAAGADLAYLAAVAPETKLGPRAPPELTQSWAAAVQSVQPYELEVQADAVPAGVRVRASYRGGPPGASARTRYHVRTEGANWQQSSGPETRYPATPGTRIEYYVELLGMGGVVLRSAGTVEEPSAYVMEAPPGAPAAIAVTPQGPRSDERSNLKWWLIGGGAAVAVAVGVVLAVVLTAEDKSDRSQVDEIEFDFGNEMTAESATSP